MIPATVTAKLHLTLGPIKPSVGAGGTWFLRVDSKPGVATIPLGRAKSAQWYRPASTSHWETTPWD